MEQLKQADHRWSIRQRLVLDVRLYGDNQLLLRGFTRDISIGGMFIETGGVRLPLNAQMFASFTLPSRSGLSHHRLPARVIRVDTDGAGLMFTDFSVATVKTLRELLYAPVS